MIGDGSKPGSRHEPDPLREDTQTNKDGSPDPFGQGWPNGASTRLTSTGPENSFLGAIVGNYQVESIIGRGGFGTVFKARDIKLGRDAALKCLHEQVEPHRLQLFEREAKALAALSKHPSIVQIYAWGEYAGRVYIAMEFVPSSAHKLLGDFREGLPPPKALQIAAKACDALAFAHEQKILHRDIKPANILIEDIDGSVKIADFGLARFYESSQVSTVMGTISGTPPYMSPEQASCKSLDKRSDLFSLGVTLYLLLCGKLPFEGTTSTEVMERIRNDEKVSLRERRPDLHPLVIQIVDKAMAHNPARRFQSAEEFAADLRAAIDVIEGRSRAETLPSSKASPLAGRRLVPVAAILGAFALLVAAGVWIFGGAAERGLLALPLAEARELMDSEEFTTAEARYRAFLETNPGDENALYGLGYALLQQGKSSDAQAVFEKIDDASLHTEGTAAVAYNTNGEEARKTLQAALLEVSSAYPATLLAALDLHQGDYEQAVKELTASQRKGFNFDWQRAVYLRMLGRARRHGVRCLNETRHPLHAPRQTRGGAWPDRGEHLRSQPGRVSCQRYPGGRLVRHPEKRITQIAG